MSLRDDDDALLTIIKPALGELSGLPPSAAQVNSAAVALCRHYRTITLSEARALVRHVLQRQARRLRLPADVLPADALAVDALADPAKPLSRRGRRPATVH